jgi:hypothetical protein
MYATWLGDELDEEARLGISTAAVRGYLWRTVEDGPTGFLEPGLSEAVASSRLVGDDRDADEPLGVTLYFAASQCIADGVHTRLGSLGGLTQGAKFYEKAFHDTTDDLDDLGFLEEGIRRLAFQFGVSLADSEQVLARSTA